MKAPLLFVVLLVEDRQRDWRKASRGQVGIPHWRFDHPRSQRNYSSSAAASS